MLIAIGLIEPTQSPGPPTRIPGSSLPHVVSERFYQNFFYRNFLLQNNVNRPNIDYFILNSAVLKQSLFLFIINCSRFYRAAWNAVCPSVCPSVCLSVHLSYKRVDCDKTEKKICPDFYTIRKII